MTQTPFDTLITATTAAVNAVAPGMNVETDIDEQTVYLAEPFVWVQIVNPTDYPLVYATTKGEDQETVLYEGSILSNAVEAFAVELAKVQIAYALEAAFPEPTIDEPTPEEIQQMMDIADEQNQERLLELGYVCTDAASDFAYDAWRETQRR